MPLFHWNFTSRIAVAAALLTLSVLLGGGAVSHYAMKNLMQKKLHNSLSYSATSIAQQLHAKLEALADTAADLAANTLIGSAIADDVGRQLYLEGFLQDFSTVSGVPISLAVTDFEGSPYALSRDLPLLAEAEWLAEAVEQGIPRSRCTEYQGQHYMVLAVPVIYVNTGLPEGALVLQARLDLLLSRQHIRQAFDIEPAFQDKPPHVTLNVVAPCGKQISIFQTDYATDTFMKTKVSGLEDLPGWRFEIYLLSHISLFNEPLQRLLYTYLVLGGGMIVLVILVSRWLAYSLTRSLRTLEESAHRIASAKDFGGRLPVHGYDEVAHLGASFNQVLEHLERAYGERQRAEAAEAANHAKNAFIANMSHELRTPLNAVLGFAQLLSNDRNLTAEQVKYVQSIKRGGGYLLILINDILDLAKIEAGHFELLPTIWDSENFFENLVHIFQIRAQQKGIEFHCKSMTPIPPALECDEKRLRQITLNLLGNAVKFTDHGGVTLRIGYQTGYLKLEVEDTGVGIAQDQLEQIFQPFTQLGDVLQKREGAGLGLAITRRIVEAMQGTLEVESSLRQGSCFRVRIPARAVQTENVPHAAAAPPKVVGYRRRQGEGALKILLAEDIADNREVLGAFLKPLGFSLQEVENGVQCLRNATQWNPDLILMDLRMPEMDGLEATRRLRTLPDFKETPIIAVSASAFGKDREEAVAAGCNEHLPKPVEMEKLLDKLKDYLPLEWVYETNTEKIPDSAMEKTVQEVSLNAAQCDDLMRMTKVGDIGSILTYLEKLQSQSAHPEVPRLLEIAQRFQLGILKKELEKIKANF